MGVGARTSLADAMMAEFSERTGIIGGGDPAQRYLWTDAFAVRAFLGLHRLTEDPGHLVAASRLVELVHAVLGRHREDDLREGWISGLGPRAGLHHPTVGGLRIGKPLPERPATLPLDERLEWERDGQYFHYLTRWITALGSLAQVASSPVHAGQAMDLAEAAWRGFASVGRRGVEGVHWKMSIDLTRPLVPATGSHDPLDGYVACLQLTAVAPAPRPEGFDAARRGLQRLCVGRRWATGDSLGIGGMLVDATHLAGAAASGNASAAALLPSLLEDTRRSIAGLVASRSLERPAAERLAFRELGLSGGLRAVEGLPPAIESARDMFSDPETLLDLAGQVLRHRHLADRIERFWADPVHRRFASWNDHRDINTVMLAASLVEDAWLTPGPAREAGIGAKSSTTPGPPAVSTPESSS